MWDMQVVSCRMISVASRCTLELLDDTCDSQRVDRSTGPLGGGGGGGVWRGHEPPGDAGLRDWLGGQQPGGDGWTRRSGVSGVFLALLARPFSPFFWLGGFHY